MKALKYGIVFVLFICIWSSMFYVKEGSVEMLFMFGKPTEEILEPGLHFKIPVVQTRKFFDVRMQEWDGDPNQFPTKDRKLFWVDTMARWRIADPLKYYKTVGTFSGAQTRIDDILDSLSRDEVSSNLLVDIVRGVDYDGPNKDEGTEGVGRETIRMKVYNKGKEAVKEYGIELVDFEFKRLNYVDKVERSVFERMINERKKVAAQYRSEGDAEQAKILGEMEKELKSIRSGATRRATEIKGEADAEATRIYAEAYSKDENFYAFLKTMESYQQAFPKNGKMVLSADSEFFKFLKGY